MRKEGWPRRGALHLKKDRKKIFSVKKYGVYILTQQYNGLLRLYRFRLARLNTEKSESTTKGEPNNDKSNNNQKQKKKYIGYFQEITHREKFSNIHTHTGGRGKQSRGYHYNKL